MSEQEKQDIHSKRREALDKMTKEMIKAGVYDAEVQLELRDKCHYDNIDLSKQDIIHLVSLFGLECVDKETQR